MRMAALRGLAPSILVAALSSAFGVMLLTTTDILQQILRDSSLSSSTLEFVLSFIALVFVAIAIYVGAIVIANTFATTIAGRSRTIALLRLLGSSASDQRRSVLEEGAVVAAVGSAIGVAGGVLATFALVSVGMATGTVPDGDYSFVGLSTVVPVLAVAATTLASSWVGSRRVLVVSPMEAVGSAGETTLPEENGRRARNLIALAMFLVGGLILGAGVLIGSVSPLGLLVGVFGGMLSFSGVVAGSTVVMPRALRMVGRVFGSGATARLARENAVRYPERTARTTIGLVIGVTLITTFAVTVETFQVIIRTAQKAQPGIYEGVEPVLQVTVVVFSALMGFSALIAAVGLVNNLSLNVTQRTRELGLLRALGFTANQVRTMILRESAQLIAGAVTLGLVLGTFYGWAGAQSLVGSLPGSPGIVVPAIPVAVVATIAAAATLLAVVASIAPARRATRVSPVVALAAE